MTPWEEVSELIASCRVAFVELEKMHRTYFDTFGMIKTNAGAIVDRCARLQADSERLVKERDAVAVDLKNRKRVADDEIQHVYDARLQDVTRDVEREASERRKVLDQISAEIAMAKVQLQTLVQFVDEAGAKKAATVAAIDADVSKAKKRMMDSQRLADQAMKEYEQTLQYIDSRGSQREAEQKARIAVLDNEIQKAEERLAAVKQAARVALAAIGEN